MFPVADPELAAHARSAEFLNTPVDWYFHLALDHVRARPRLPEHDRRARARSSPRSTTCSPAPATCPAAASGSTTRRTSSSAARHFIQMEQPDEVHELLLEFLERVG